MCGIGDGVEDAKIHCSVAVPVAIAVTKGCGVPSFFIIPNVASAALIGQMGCVG